MHQFYPEPKTDIERANNLRTIERSFNSSEYFVTLDAVEFVPDTTLVGAANFSSTQRVYSLYPNAADTVMRAMLRRPERWLNGQLRWKSLWYTGDVAGNNFFGDLMSMRSYAKDAIFGVPTATTGSISITIPGPTAINQLMKLDLTTRNDLFLNCTTQIDWFNIQINRDGAHASDTNTGELHIIGLDLEYTEKERFIGEDYNKPPYY